MKHKYRNRKNRTQQRDMVVLSEQAAKNGYEEFDAKKDEEVPEQDAISEEAWYERQIFKEYKNFVESHVDVAPRQCMIELLQNQQYNLALEYFTEHKKDISVLERSLMFRVIEDGLEGRNHLGSLLTVILLSVELNLIFGDAIVTQVLDCFSFLVSIFPYFHYYKYWVLPGIDILIWFIAIICTWINMLYPWIVLKRKPKLVLSLASAGTIVTLAFQIVTLVQPLYLDYAYVKNYTCETRIYTSQERNYGLFEDNHYPGKAYMKEEFQEELSDRKHAIEEFHPEYLAKSWMEYTPKKILGIKEEMAYTVWISEEESLPMSNQQKLSYGIKDEDFQMQENGDIMIQYLPHTKTILNIREFDPLEEAVESEKYVE